MTYQRVKNKPDPRQKPRAGHWQAPKRSVYFFVPGVAALFLGIDSMLPLPVALPWCAALEVELEREARLAPVAGAVLILLPVALLPGTIGALGATVVALGAWPLAFFVMEARRVGETEPLLERGICAETVPMPIAKAARTRRFFIRFF